MFEPDYADDDRQQQQAMEERLRAELDSLIVVHKHGLPKEAERIAGYLGITKEFHQEINAHERANA